MPKGVYERTEEHRKNISVAKKGRTFTEEHKKHLSESRKGIKFTEEHIKNLSESHKGQVGWNTGKVRIGEYKYKGTGKNKKPLAHHIWFEHNNSWPDKEEVIHHKDFNVGNNHMYNLQLMKRTEHISLHNDIRKVMRNL